MKISINTTTLLKALKIAGKVIPTNPSIPALGCFLFKVKNGVFTVTSSNNEMHLTIPIQTEQISEEGDCLIPYKRISDFISLLPNEIITIETSERNVLISWKKGKKTESCPDVADYPLFAEPKEPTNVSLDAQELKNALGHTIPFCANTEIRPILMGVHFDIKKDSVSIVATDSHQMRLHTIQANNNAEAKFTLFRNTAQVLESVITKDSKQVVVSADNKTAVFTVDGTVIITKTIEGKYPNYKTVIPAQETAKGFITIEKEEFIRTMKRLGNNAQNVLLTTTPMFLHLRSEDFSANSLLEEDFDCVSSGNDNSILLNAQRLLNILTSIEGEKTLIRVIDDRSPLVFLDEKNNENTSIALLMPLAQPR